MAYGGDECQLVLQMFRGFEHFVQDLELFSFVQIRGGTVGYVCT